VVGVASRTDLRVIRRALWVAVGVVAVASGVRLYALAHRAVAPVHVLSPTEAATVLEDSVAPGGAHWGAGIPLHNQPAPPLLVGTQNLARPAGHAVWIAFAGTASAARIEGEVLRAWRGVANSGGLWVAVGMAPPPVGEARALSVRDVTGVAARRAFTRYGMSPRASVLMVYVVGPGGRERYLDVVGPSPSQSAWRVVAETLAKQGRASPGS
jgi:hypothetical protein